jgi:hypothetical protein
MLIASAAEAALLLLAPRSFPESPSQAWCQTFAIPLMAVAQIASMIVVPLFLGRGLIRNQVVRVSALRVSQTANLVAARVTWRRATTPIVTAMYARLVLPHGGLARRVRFTGTAESVSRDTRAAAVARHGALDRCEPWTAVHGAGDSHLHVTFIDVGQAIRRSSVSHGAARGRRRVTESGSFDIGDRVRHPCSGNIDVRRLQNNRAHAA